MEITVHPDRQVTWPGHRADCAIGTGGLRLDKREGDGATPVGVWPLRRVFYRLDRIDRPETALPTTPLTPDDGWCDDPHHPDYNRLVSLPHAARHERLWRDDGLYDLIVVLGYNDEPVAQGRGSAIFMHIAKPDYAGTEGCVALARKDLVVLLKDCGPDTTLRILPPDTASV